MAWQHVTNVRGPEGKQGKDGNIGLPGPGSVAADVATAAYVAEPTSDTRGALEADFVQNSMIEALIAQRFPAVVQVPAAVGMSMPITIVRDEGGAYSANVDPAALFVPGAGPTYYVDPVAGSNTNTGLSWAQAFATPAYASLKNTGDYGTIIVKGGVYQRVDNPGINGSGNKSIKAAPGERVIFVTGDRLTVWTSQGGGVFTGSVATCNGVLDARTRDGHGVAQRLQLAASESEVSTTPGTYVYSAGVVRVHLLDGRTPDADVYVSRPVNSLGATLAAGKAIYLEGCEWWGGTTANISSLGDDTRLYARDCGWHLSQTTNGLSVLGVAQVVLDSCSAHSNRMDGFNYHDHTSGRTGEVIEINCRADGNGAVTGSQNGSTSHDNYRIVRAGGVYGGNMGANVADVNNAKSFNAGVTAASSIEAGVDFLGDNMWLDACVSGSLVAAQVATPGTGTVRTKQLLRAGATVGTTDSWT